MADKKPLILRTRQGEARHPSFERLHGGRWRMTRFFDVGQLGHLPADLFQEFGEPDVANTDNREELKDLCFIATGTSAEGRDSTKPLATLVYETLTNEWVDEEAPVIDKTENGLRRITHKLIAKKGTAFLAGAGDEIGASTYKALYESLYDTVYSGTEKLALFKDNSTDYAGRLTLVYLEPGQISQSDEYSNNDKLHVRSITAFGLVPSTPSGFVFVGSQASETEGTPTRTYRFAKGEGEISRDPESSNNGALRKVSIRRLSAPGTTITEATAVATFAPGDNFVLVAGPTLQEADGHRIWSASFAKGTGVVSRTPGERNNGKLLTLEIRALSAPGAGNPITPEETYYPLPASYQEADGHRIWTQEFAKGEGRISRDEDGGPVPGTKNVTIVHLTSPNGNQPAHEGVLIRKRDEEANGHKVWTLVGVTGTIIGNKTSWKDAVEVRTPGVVTLSSVSITAAPGITGDVAVVNVVPPRVKRVKATVTLSIQSTPPDEGGVAYDLGEISCSITTIKSSYNANGFDVSKTAAGTVTVTTPRRSAGIGCDIQHFPGHYISGDANISATFSYVGAEQHNVGETVITTTPLTSTITTRLIGAGSTSLPGSYQTAGVLLRKGRPVFTALDGTTYYEVLTWTV